MTAIRITIMIKIKLLFFSLTTWTYGGRPVKWTMRFKSETLQLQTSSLQASKLVIFIVFFMKLLFVKILYGSIFHYLIVSHLIGSNQYDFIHIWLMLKRPASLFTIAFHNIPWTERFLQNYKPIKCKFEWNKKKKSVRCHLFATFTNVNAILSQVTEGESCC